MSAPIASQESLAVSSEYSCLKDVGDLEETVSILQTDCVLVENAEKAYRPGCTVLSRLNMAIPSACIYALIGSSGCGKTTLLKSILGIQKLDKGSVTVFGSKPGKKYDKDCEQLIGYMPQEISLYLDFTINEMLSYFGKLYGMNTTSIKAAIEFTCGLLDLPKTSRKISSLSGGQQRRVSFAATLIHEPQFLILDEPTVGVDAILREKIWNHLEKLVDVNKTTILVTTHYIGEATKATNIGIMRGGRLLKEKPLSELMAEYNNASLEDIVLILCKREEAIAKTNKVDKDKIQHDHDNMLAQCSSCDEIKYLNSINATSGPDKDKSCVLSIKNCCVRIRALTGKNFTILFRSLLLLSFVVWIPASELVIFCIALGNEPTGLPVGVVNFATEHPDGCKNITRVVGKCNIDYLSCLYLDQLPKSTLDLIQFETETEATHSVRDGSTWGYIMFPENFTDFFINQLSLEYRMKTDEATWLASSITVRLDESNKQVAMPIKKALFESFQQLVENLLFDCGLNPKAGESQLKYHKPILGRSDTVFIEYLAPGCSLALVFFFPIITSSITFIKEKKSGMAERNFVAGVQTWETMIAYFISESCVLVVQCSLCFVVVTLLFAINVQGSSLQVFILYLLSGYTGMSLGFLLGTLCTEEIHASMIGMASVFPNFLLSALLWPIEGMPLYLQKISQALLPCTIAAESIRSIVSRGWEFSHPVVWPGFAVLSIYISGFFVVNVVLQKMLKKF